MKEIIIGPNDAGRRLDRFLRKYFRNASLSEIYKLIRKDIKVDGRRRNEAYMLQDGETVTFYISDELLDRFTGAQSKTDASRSSGAKSGLSRNTGDSATAGGRVHAKKQFSIVYEDEHILIADKPFGLLTHGDSQEKKNHLANQVKDYLIERGEFNPRAERVFSPAPANRIDRNTTGLVLFGKTAEALKGLNKIIRENKVKKFYLTIVCGKLESERKLTGTLVKDHRTNKVTVSTSENGTDGLEIVTIVRPQKHFRFKGQNLTLVEVELVTGRSHQIRAHLAGIGYPIIGDSKYATAASRRINEAMFRQMKLSTQLLHAYRLEFADELDIEGLEYLSGRKFTAELPDRFREIELKITEG